MEPSFVRMLSSDSVQTVLITGCGGGFDFVHGALLLPLLKAKGKRVVIVSFSFGSPGNISGPTAETVFSEETPQGVCEAKLMSAACTGAGEPVRYAPEIGFCSFLDERWPEDAPHQIYACNARLFSPPMLLRLHRQVMSAHGVDTIVTIDGGSDSLMRGDESGLGDPIEDCVSVTASAALGAADGIRTKLLVSIGFGMDRFNNVCDADGLRAIAELSAAGGFRGSLSIEPDSEAFRFYRDCVARINAQQTFRSVMSMGTIAAIEGQFGYVVPEAVRERVREGHLYLWPLMGMLFAFDPDAVARRSLLSPLLRECEQRVQCDAALATLRDGLASEGKLLPVADVPMHNESLRRRFNVAEETRDIVVETQQPRRARPCIIS